LYYVQAVQVGRLPPDDDHPYGHGKFEAIGSLFLALTLLGTGISVGAMLNKRLIESIALQRSTAGSALAPQVPKLPALLMAAISIFSKEWLFRITRTVGESLNSQVIIANAWHHRSDVYSSILATVCIGLAICVPAFVAADAAAGLLVAGMICMTGANILGESVKQLTDTMDQKLVQKVTNIVTNSKDVASVNRVRARQV
jgi:cation diffusion facilitator family transporter